MKKPAMQLNLYSYQVDWFVKQLAKLNKKRKEEGLPKLSKQKYIESLLVKDGMPIKI